MRMSVQTVHFLIHIDTELNITIQLAIIKTCDKHMRN